jgi:carboxymethylenebutenolidase
MPLRHVCTVVALAALAATVACAHRSGDTSATAVHPERGTAAAEGDSAHASSTSQGTAIPPAAEDAKARLAASPRHGEWAMIGAGPDSVRAWVVYPERKTKAPVVVVVHEIFGLSTWVRAVADQLAADGFIAIAPDLLTGKKIPQGGPDSVSVDSARAVIGTLNPEDVKRQIDATARYGMSLPAAAPRYGVVGFCWGGSTAFAYAAATPTLGAAVVFYGSAPEPGKLANLRAPVLGLYGENDERVNATIPAADSALKATGRTFEHRTFPGAGHGFLRAQNGQNGANLAAAKQAWPLVVAWFKKYLGT